jgi:addiction module RelB/DinJ family antitoxin
VKDAVKRQAEATLAELGMSLSTATAIFLKQVIRSNGITFEVRFDPYAAAALRKVVEFDVPRLQKVCPVKSRRASIMQKFLLCIPGGGFNDILCQAARCLRYAEKFHRTLVIDTRRSSLADDFSRWFLYDGKAVRLCVDEDLRNTLCAAGVYPPFLKGRLTTFTTQYDKDGKFVDAETGSPVSFNFRKDYAEELLVHCNLGGGYKPLAVLRKLRLQPAVAAHIIGQTRCLERGYCAVHVRNTDYRTDYMPFFRSIRTKVAGRTLVVCSDDRNCREAARQFFTESTVVSGADIPDTGGKALHFYNNGDVYAKNLAMLTDLFTLAGARDLFFTRVAQGVYSGFSALAYALHRRPDIVKRLLGRPVTPADRCLALLRSAPVWFLRKKIR